MATLIVSAPLAHDSSPEISSPVSPRGFHTPVEDEAPRLQAPSPTSALATVSGLEGYLEPQRMSFGSPPMSELLPRIPSMDDSFPVFSPPPYGAVVAHRVSGPPWLPLYSTPRHSLVSVSTPRSHHTCSVTPFSLFLLFPPPAYRLAPHSFELTDSRGYLYSIVLSLSINS